MSTEWFKYVRKSRKEWECSICKKSIEIGSEYFMDVRVQDRIGFDQKRYHCDCWGEYSDWIDDEIEKSILIEEQLRNI